jgi:predicted TIM-barrel fold metal-dependent hydrolase
MGAPDQRAQHHSRVTRAVTDRQAASGWDCHVHVFAAGQPVTNGHYAPQYHPLERIEALAAAQGFEHLVLVQPSVYGSDNSLMLSALEKSKGLHRGVVVVQDIVSDADLQRWHTWGVRGIRCNLVSPVGNQQTDWRLWAPRLRALGWHVQWYAHGDQLGAVLKWQQQYGLPCVLDHVAGMHTRLANDAVAWANLSVLAQQAAWIKLSGWYRLGLSAPYDLNDLRLLEICEMFKDRILWGSDWPHTSFATSDAPSYTQVWEPLRAMLGQEQCCQLNTNAARLYG